MSASHFWRLLATVSIAAGCLLAGCKAPAQARAQLPSNSESFATLWAAYRARFIAPSGRVIDDSHADRRTTSEGQAYALFFSLVANDRPLFGHILTWTRNNMAQGDLSKNLPAWLWGRKKDGGWGVKDSNSAADADLWLAYTLIQAGRLWHKPAYTSLGKHLADKIASQEMATIGSFGPILLPGQTGFGPTDNGCYNLNFSYMPLPLLEYMSRYLGSPWRDLADNLPKLLAKATPKGFAADWNRWCPSSGLGIDPKRGPTGSFDAIRVYLWAGLSPAALPGQSQITSDLDGMTAYLKTHESVPERINTMTGTTQGHAPVGFDAALMPFARALGLNNAFNRLARRVRAAQNAKSHLLGQPARYYDQNLALFAFGRLDQAYRFTHKGQLSVRWNKQGDS